MFLDLIKTFDTVDDSVLLAKCQMYGLRGPVHSIVRPYLSDIKQFVCHQCVSSNMKPVETGVPQGSVIGPMLFLLYINDLFPKAERSSEIILFDDGTTSHGKLKNIESIESNLTEISIWMAAKK